MLEALVSTLRSATEVALLAAVIVLLIRKNNRWELQGLIWRSLGTGFLAGIILAAGSKYLHLRDMVDALVLLGATLGEAWLLWWIFRGTRQSGESGKLPGLAERVSLFLVTSLLVLPKGTELVNFPTTLFIQNTDFLNTELLLKVAFGALGVVLALFLGVAFAKSGTHLGRRDFRFIASAMLAILMVSQSVGFLQIL